MIIRADTLSDEKFTAALQRSAAFWGEPLASPENLPRCAQHDRQKLRERFSNPPSDAGYHYVPSAFTFEDAPSFIPVERSMHWMALEKTIQATVPQAALSVLPLSLQLDPLVVSTFHSSRILGTVTAPGNIPLALEIIRQLGAELVITTPRTAVEMLTAAPDVALSIRAWYLILDSAAEAGPMPHRGIVLRDIHVIPGISVAWQCSQLAERKDVHYHPSPHFVWEAEEGCLLVTNIDAQPAPLFRMPVGRGTLEPHTCVCGSRYTLTFTSL